RYVAYRVAAGFTDRYPIFFKTRPQFRCTVETDVVDLNVLPGRRVQVTARIFIGNVSDAPQLLRCQATKRKLNANHLHAGLALSVNASRKSQASELVIVQIALAE